MKKEINYFLARLKLLWLENREYRINLLMGLIANISLFLTHIMVFFILGEIFLFDFGLVRIDFVLLFSLLLFSSIAWRLFANPLLAFYLKSGKINKIITLPISPFLFQMPIHLRGVGLVNIMINGIIILILLLTLGYINLLSGLILLILGLFFQISIMNCIFSTSFFMKESSFLYKLYYHNLTITIEDFTPIPFQKTFFYNVVSFFPASIYGFWTLLEFKGMLTNYEILVLVSLVGGIFFSIITYLNWKIGLKKYEVYG